MIKQKTAKRQSAINILWALPFFDSRKRMKDVINRKKLQENELSFSCSFFVLWIKLCEPNPGLLRFCA